MQPARTSVRASEVAGRAVALQVGWRVVGGWSTQAHACGSEWRSDGVTPSWGARGPGGTRAERGSARQERAARLRASCDGARQRAWGGLMGGRSGPPLRFGPRASCGGTGQRAEGGLMGGRSGPPLRFEHSVAASRLVGGSKGGADFRSRGKSFQPKHPQRYCQRPPQRRQRQLCLQRPRQSIEPARLA